MKNNQCSPLNETPPLVTPVICAGLLTLSPCHALDDENVPIEELPDAVRAALEATVPGIIIDEIELESDDPELLIYEIEGNWEGQEVELEISALGDVLEFEEEDEDDDEDYEDDEDSDEESITFEELPENVASIVNSLFPNLVPDEIERETEDGVTVYEIEGTDGDNEVSVEISESGEIVELENSAGISPVPGLPEVIQMALTENAPGAAILEYEKKESGDNQVHKFEGVLNEQEVELAIASDGQVLSVDYEAVDDDDDDDHEEEYEEEIPVDQLPEAIQTYMTNTYPGFHYREIELETEDGEERYEVEGCLEDGQALELLFAANGELIRMEVDSDDDGLCDADEIEMGADPMDDDTDDDVFPDGFEVERSSDPTDPNSQPQVLSVSLVESNGSRAFDVCVETFANGIYQLEEHQENGQWLAVGEPFQGAGEACNVVVSLSENGLGLFRVVIRSKATD